MSYPNLLVCYYIPTEDTVTQVAFLWLQTGLGMLLSIALHKGDN